MVGSKEEATARLEIDFRVLVGELRVMEDDIKRMSIRQFIDVWGPELKEARIMLKLIDLRGVTGNEQESKSQMA